MPIAPPAIGNTNAAAASTIESVMGQCLPAAAQSSTVVERAIGPTSLPRLRRPSRADPQPTFVAAGGFQLPSMIEGGVSSGQYMRSIRRNLPAGAGSQFDSLSAPGDWFWK